MEKMYLATPDKYTKERCRLFADFSVGSSVDEYARRNQHNIDKIKLDIYRGKLAEFMVRHYMVTKGNETTKPDVDIYRGCQKNYDADLVCEGKNLHVKSHFMNRYYPVSWLFQKKDKLVSCENNDDFLCLVVMEESGGAWFYIQKPNEKLFKKPQKSSLEATKVCIYEQDILTQ